MSAHLLSESELAAIAAPSGPPARSRLAGEIGAIVEPARLAFNAPPSRQGAKGQRSPSDHDPGLAGA